MRDGSAFSAIWVIFIIIGIILRTSSAKKKKEQQKESARRGEAMRARAAKAGAPKAPDFGEIAARRFAQQAGVPSAPAAAAAPVVTAAADVPPAAAPAAEEVYAAREDFAPEAYEGEGAYAQGSMEFAATEGEEEEEHSEHLRSAEEARKRDEPVKKKPRFDQKHLRSAFIASEVLGRPVAMR